MESLFTRWLSTIATCVKSFDLTTESETKVSSLTTALRCFSLVIQNCSFLPPVPCEKIGMSIPMLSGLMSISTVSSLSLKLRRASVSTLEFLSK